MELAEHFLARGSETPPVLSAETRDLLLNYSWPGNVRELPNVLDVAAALTEGESIDPRHLDLQGQAKTGVKGNYHQQIEDLRRRLVTDAMEEAKGNQTEAARHLGLSRQALSYLVRKLKILQ